MTTVGFYQQKAREIPIVGDYDVVVVGGGCAGFAAAVAASTAWACTASSVTLA